MEATFGLKTISFFHKSLCKQNDFSLVTVTKFFLNIKLTVFLNITQIDFFDKGDILYCCLIIHI